MQTKIAITFVILVHPGGQPMVGCVVLVVVLSLPQQLAAVQPIQSKQQQE